MNEHKLTGSDASRISLTSAEIARLTAGAWEGLEQDTGFTGTCTGEHELIPGELYFPLEQRYSTPEFLASIKQAGASAAVVQRNVTIDNPPLPLLRVDDPTDALRIIAEANMQRSKARRILITGSEGKTGLKFLLHHIAGSQTHSHAKLNSSNLHVPIWESLASIHREDEYAIIEVSVANPGRGRERSEIIQPHVCVITGISGQHMFYHGTIDRLIRHKAEVVTSILPDGVCFTHADSEHYSRLKDEIQRIRPIPVVTFGTGEKCEGRLLHAQFIEEKQGWQVQARIFGKSVNYFISMVNSYTPLASVSALTIATYMGLDLAKAAASLASFQPYDTAGRILRLPVMGGEFTLIDHSLRGSLSGFRSAFDDLYRLHGKGKARLVLGAILDLGNLSKPQHRQLAGLIDAERTEKIYTVGDEMKIVRDAFADKSKLGPHGDTPEDIAEELFDDIRPGDIVFIKGHHRVWLSRLVHAMEEHFRMLALTPHVPIAMTSADKPIRPEPETTPVIQAAPPAHTLVAGGDVMLSRDLPGLLAARGGDDAFRDIRPLLSQADIALVNLECVLSNRGNFFDKNGRRPFYYRCPPALVNVLVTAGITAVATANNHAMDFDTQALLDQIAILDDTRLAHAGSGANLEQAMQPMYLKAGKLVVAVISFATELPLHAASSARPGIFEVSLNREGLERLRPAIEQARQHADLVIASPHWGENWKEQPTEDIRRLAWGMIDLGVDAILGHSAHILQGVEVYRGKFIAYDMGTLLFDRVGEHRMRQSALFELGFGAQGIERLVIHPLQLEAGRARLADAEEAGATLQKIVELSRVLNPAVEFHKTDATLELRVEAAGLATRKHYPGLALMRKDVHALQTVQPPADILFASTPPELAGQEGVDLGDSLEVLGASFPEQVHPGFGFVLQVWFRCPDTGGQRWRASLVARHTVTGDEFRYRHPVAEGMWVSQDWDADSIVCDRIVVRPPDRVAAGKYELFWNLVDADTGKLRKTAAGHKRIKNGWLSLGSIDFDAKAPRVVAGVAEA